MLNSTHAHFNVSAREVGAKLKPHGSFRPPFCILTVEWSGARSCLFWWRRRFQIASFSPSTQENSVFEKHRFQIASLCRAFTNGSVFGDRFRRCSVDDSRIWSKTAPFSFENGLVWTGSNPFSNEKELFCSVCKKVCVHTYRFRIVSPVHTPHAVSVLKTLLYPQCACSNELHACAFQIIRLLHWVTN